MEKYIVGEEYYFARASTNKVVQVHVRNIIGNTYIVTDSKGIAYTTLSDFLFLKRNDAKKYLAEISRNENTSN